jgi:hypothetical protein
MLSAGKREEMGARWSRVGCVRVVVLCLCNLYMTFSKLIIARSGPCARHIGVFLPRAPVQPLTIPLSPPRSHLRSHSSITASFP